MVSLRTTLFGVLFAALCAAACGTSDPVQSALQDESTTTGADAGTAGHKCPPPPQEALDACATLTAGDTCDFTHDGNDVAGTCKNGPDGNGPLACAPSQPPPGGPGNGQMPPPESLAACATSTAGDTCDFTHDGHDVTGTCKNGPDGNGPLACAPADAPGF